LIRYILELIRDVESDAINQNTDCRHLSDQIHGASRISESDHGGNGPNSGNELGKLFDFSLDELLVLGINNDGGTLSS
jgi:hypothetical protein